MTRRDLALSLLPFGLAAACNRNGKRKDGPGKVSPTGIETVPNPNDRGTTPNFPAEELQIDYSILLEDGASGRRVNEKFHFRSGDKFQIQLRPAFPAYIYLLNRGARQKEDAFLFPLPKLEHQNPIPAGRTVTLPGASDYYTLDSTPGIEYLTLIAAPILIHEFDEPASKIKREDFEERLAIVERDFRPTSSRRFEDKEWTKLFAARGAKTAFVLRMPLDHR